MTVMVRVMARLLCLVSGGDFRRGSEKIIERLKCYWEGHFDAIGIRELPFSSPEETKAIGDALERGDYSHLWICADLETLTRLADAGVCSERLPNVMMYAYALIESPFIDVKYVATPADFDFFVTASPMAATAIKNLYPGMTGLPKAVYRALENILVIPIGIHTDQFYPLNVQAREPSFEEIRQCVFDGKVSGEDFLVVVAGRPSKKKGLPEAFATIKALQRQYQDRPVKAYFHMSSTTPGLDLQTLAAGNELTVGEDVFFGDGRFPDEEPKWDGKQMNYLFNCADLFLCTDAVSDWPFCVTEAMASGCLVAAPNEHVWMDVIDNNRGIPLPTSQFNWAPWDQSQFVRMVNSDGAANAILKVLEDDTHKTIRENGIAWAHQEPLNDWKNIANAWLRIFGL